MTQLQAGGVQEAVLAEEEKRIYSDYNVLFFGFLPRYSFMFMCNLFILP